MDPHSEPSASDLPAFRIDWGLQGLLRLIDSCDFRTVLDIGSGGGDHARLLRHLGKSVVTIDLHRDADIRADFMEADLGETFDAVWCSHVLEHQRNVGAFLEKLRLCIAPGGVLAISVPTHPPDRMVAGHVTAWNPWLLCYNLVLAGFDCSQARYTTTVDLSLLVRSRPAGGGDILKAAGSGADLDPAGAGDPLSPLAPFFPFPIRQGGDPPPAECGWGSLDYRMPAGVAPFRLHSRFLPEEGLLIR